MKRKFKNEKGITLVALVVTIIILIILAGVSINAVFGENGIITLAKKAKENMELAQIEEQESLGQLFDDFEAQESLIEGTPSYNIALRFNEFKKKIAEYIDEAANGQIDTTNEYTKLNSETASVETFGQAIKQIVAKVTSDATATEDDIVEGKTAWVNGEKIIGKGTASLDAYYKKEIPEILVSISSSHYVASCDGGKSYSYINSSASISIDTKGVYNSQTGGGSLSEGKLTLSCSDSGSDRYYRDI